MLTIILITKRNKREGLLSSGTWAAYGIIPQKGLDISLEASFQPVGDSSVERRWG